LLLCLLLQYINAIQLQLWGRNIQIIPNLFHKHFKPHSLEAENYPDKKFAATP
jgi:hypothetical protein